MPENVATLFTLEHLGLSYRARPALRDINWRWQRGEHWAVLGPNGAGKTALATVLAGEQRYFSGSYQRSAALSDGGTAYVCFERGRRLCERDRKLDCAEFEAAAVDVGTRVSDLLDPGGARSEREQVVDLLGIAPILDRGLRFISTGEMRKSLLAAALLEQPALMILDSPLDGLDRSMQAHLGAALEQIIPAAPAVLVLAGPPRTSPQHARMYCCWTAGASRPRVRARRLLGSTVEARVMAPPPLALEAPPVQRRHAAVDGDTLALRGVSVRFGDTTILRDINWSLGPGQHCMISGPNGSGKSTLLDLLTGDNHKAYGQDVTLFGRRRGSGESVWDIKAQFGRVDARMQSAFPVEGSVLDTVVSGFYDSLGLYDRASDSQRAAARQWLTALGLQDFAPQTFGSLSFGVQRLVLLARAVVKQPRVLLLDEATLSLDAGHRRLLLDAIDHVIAHGDSQLLFVSHSAGERPRCINQLLTLEPGPEGSAARVEDVAAPAG